ncbi:MAG: glycosyltransferase family 4 protein [Candidatus Bathyarchaeia archaeon]
MAHPLTVMMFTWEFPPRIIGGISAHIYNLSRNLARMGLDIHVVTCDFPGAKAYESVDRVHVHRIDSYRYPTPDFGSWTYMMNVNMQKQAIEVIRSLENGVDIIHAHDWLVANAAIGLKHLFRLPMVATIHSTEYGRRNGLHTDYHRMIHQTEMKLTYEAWRVICCSEYMASHASWVFKLDPKKIDVILNGVDPKAFVEPYDREAFRSRFARPGEKLVLYVGRLVYEKGVSVLADAISKVLPKVDAKFVIVGDGYLRDSLVRLTSKLRIAHKVIFTGFLDDRTLRLLYRTADVFVVPSLYEPFGIVALEAMAAKTPVVATGVGGLLEIVEHDRTGVRVYPKDPDSLAQGIVRVLTDRDHAKWLSENAYQRLLKAFDWSVIAEKTRDLYERIFDVYQRGSWKPIKTV